MKKLMIGLLGLMTLSFATKAQDTASNLRKVTHAIGKSARKATRATGKALDTAVKATGKFVKKTSNTVGSAVARSVDHEMKGPKGETVYNGPRGGKYYIGQSGNKVYLKKDKPVSKSY